MCDHNLVRPSSKQSKEALEEALRGLEGVIMTPHDDPKLSALKDDIRRTIEKPPDGRHIKTRSLGRRRQAR